jgi:hypothetical protein
VGFGAGDLGSVRARAAVLGSLIAVLASVPFLRADEVLAPTPTPVARQALTYEPLVLKFGYGSDLGPLSYNYALNRYFSLGGLAQLAVRNGSSYDSFALDLGVGFDFWLFGSKPLQGLFLGKRIQAENTWVVSDSQNSDKADSEGFSLLQDYETGYQWNVHNYLLAVRMRFFDFSSIDAVSASVGYAW